MKEIKKNGMSFMGTMSTIWRVFRVVWPEHRGVIVAFFVIAVLLSFLPFVSSGIQAFLINELIVSGEHGITEKIMWFLVLMIGASFFYDLLSSLRVLVNKRLWMNITEFFELIMLRKRSEIDIATYEDPKFQDLLGKASEKGIWPVCNLVENQFQQVTNLMQMTVAGIVFIVFDWRFFLLAFLSAMPDFIVQLKYGKSSWDIWDEDSQTRRKYSNIRNHFFGISRLTELKVFQNVSKFYGLVVGMYKTFNNKQRKLETNAFWWRVFSIGISMIFYGLIFFWIIWLVTNGHLKIGTMTFLTSSLGRFQNSLTGFFHNLAYQFEWSLYAKDIFKVLDTKPLIESPKVILNLSTDMPPLIEFKNISFAYPNTEKLILKNINLTINPNERLAIVGLNGAGKSTLIKLLMRFYDPTGGVILINGIDLKLIDREAWWSNVAALFQNYAEYNFPVREAIALGRSNGKGHLTKVVRCAKAVEAHSFIVDFKHQYNQMIGKEFDDGINLSVGQSQKIALARSLYRSPLLMILDEPTASIDAFAEAKIFEQLEIEHCTQIVISHRFSTVRKSDTICVLENGEIGELGTHEKLIENNKVYAQLFRLQAEGYK